MTQKDAYEKALKKGWTVDQIIVFGEEALEGWAWVSPTGEEIEVVGDWHKSIPVPDEVINTLD